MEEKTIKKGDLLKAYYEVTANDESTKQLLSGVPMIGMVIGILMMKVEDALFNGEEDKN